MDYEWYRSFAWMGVLLIILGVILILVPYAVKYAPSLGKLPPIILYVYRRNGFYFATSPILIIISLISILAFILSRYMK
jgi:hypothetical protein